MRHNDRWVFICLNTMFVVSRERGALSDLGLKTRVMAECLWGEVVWVFESHLQRIIVRPVNIPTRTPSTLRHQRCRGITPNKLLILWERGACLELDLKTIVMAELLWGEAGWDIGPTVVQWLLSRLTHICSRPLVTMRDNGWTWI